MLPTVAQFLRSSLGIPDEDDPNLAGPRPYTPAATPSEGWDASQRPSTPTDWSQPVQPPAAPSVDAGQWLAEDSVSTAPGQVAAYPGEPDEPTTPPSPYAGEQAAAMEPRADRFETQEPTQTQSMFRPVWDAAGNVIGYVQERGGRLAEQIMDPKPIVGQSEADRRLLESARTVGRPAQDAVGAAGRQIEETMGLPEGAARQAAEDVSGVLGPEGAVRTFTRAVEPVVRASGRAARRVGSELAEEGARQLMDLTPQPSMMPRGSGGIGDSGRSTPRTVEALQEKIADTRRILADIDPATERELFDQVQDRVARLTSELADAQNARLGLEPAITSDVGRRVNPLSLTEESADDLTRAYNPQERVSPEDAANLGGPASVPTPYTPSRLNSAVPFDPSAAAAGGTLGATGEGEDGEGEFDPLRAAAGMALAGMAGTPQGRRLALRAAKQAKQSAPPNLLEMMQGFRYSWGMLGNPATGLVNAMGAPVEIALGLPSEAVRMGLMRGRPIAVVREAAEMLGGLGEGARAFLGTVMGDIPLAVRNSPDFRPPLSERMQGRAGKALGHAIEFPGRLTSQAPDAFWMPIMTRWGRAREAANMMAEAGTSKLNPAAQWQEMNRLLTNPTADEAIRLDEAAKKWAEEQTYKGDAGFLEHKASLLFRSGRTPATSADPMAQQVYDLVGSIIQPFFHTIWKINKLAASRVPVVGMVTNRSLPLDEKVSRQLVGAAAGLYLADYAAQGMITGPGPSDPDEAALVNKDMPPFHTYIPAVGWVPNEWFGSLGPHLNAVGGYFDSRRYATDKEKASDTQMGERIAKDFMRGFGRFPTSQAFQQLLALKESPAKGVTDLLAGAASSFVPAPVRSGLASQDPYMRTTDRDAEFPQMLGQKLQSRTGLGRQDLPIQQDRFGRDVENQRQGAAAFAPNVKRAPGDPLTRVFRDAGVEVGLPKQNLTIDGNQIPLSSAEQRRWQKHRGVILQKYAPGMEQRPWWGNPQAREIALKDILKEAGEYADQKLMGDIGAERLRQRIRDAIQTKKAS